MSQISHEQRSKAKPSLFPVSLVVMIFIALFLMSGVHQGLIVLMIKQGWNEVLQIAVATTYWSVIALGLAIYTGFRIKKTYEEPMQKMAKATAKVASGDFSVYVPTRHTADKLDYLDVMFMDFNKMVEELGSIETLKTDFFSNVSHEIKTPLSVIHNYAELLNNENLTDEKRREYTEMILHATKRLSSLITNMLKLNKLDKQAIKPKPEPYDICSQLCECALQFEDMWDKKDIEFEADIEDRAFVCADSGLLELVWTNLLSNAVKFTPAGGTISIVQTSNKEEITVSISDTGCGMSDETMKRIFEKFYQGDTSHATEGNGLGLALVQRILQLSEGGISVKSTLGEGTTFTVKLPAYLHREEV
ncbi:MAG: HAMP domain-containing histidine kinase [Oscillospiraceae bacterium]|nr:HAMP domain-containing histidine kinase [Oscillospiraceae bacterium]